ncbi:hypothetical protein [Alicyclobacillus sp. SO9]|uniref:hypothetical protein n=1 Tax=Alicyclobacillus sp. SO9 TaxID=2665646 RepID=UPI0018E81B00|nr:hypothetical protein [Alicyclobacillus sp. SO9]QQE80903.1 hypothetical protein GI364_11260 [Alicyclobacillus sp. SO9]
MVEYEPEILDGRATNSVDVQRPAVGACVAAGTNVGEVGMSGKRKLPSWAKWAALDYEHAIEEWEYEGKLYYVVNRQCGEFYWQLNHVHLHFQGGGGAPFRTRQELDERVRQAGLRPQQQLTLDI